MKKQIAFSLLIFGTFLLIGATQAGCKEPEQESKFSLTRGQDRYVIDFSTGDVAVYDRSGSVREVLRGTAAGIDGGETPLTPAIIHYLLMANGTIKGMVWEDLNGNRFPDPNELGMPSIRVFVDADDSTGYSIGEPFAVTDSDGLYTISKVRRGTKNIFIDTATLPPDYGVTSSNPVTVSVVASQSVENIDFGVMDMQQGISGVAWDRTDNVPIPGVFVYVDLDNNNSFSPSEPKSATSGYGYYLISGLAEGTYQVRINNASLDEKFHRTPISGTNPTQVYIATGGRATVNVSYLHKATICGSLQDSSGRIWSGITLYIDLNTNGVYDAGEPTTTTDLSGSYCFDELFPGTYTLLIQEGQLPASYALLVSPGPITVGEGEDFAANFTTFQPVTISGVVWDDASGNRTREPGENGMPGVPVFLDNNNNGLPDGNEPATSTDPNGEFTFTGLVPGGYFIRVAEAPMLNAYARTTAQNPLFMIFEAGQDFDGANFGYQSKLAVTHSPRFPNRLTWSASDMLFVSDYIIDSVFIYDNTLTLTGELKGLDKPTALAIDPAGNIYVGNQGRRNVEVYDSLGTFQGVIGSNITLPNDLALDQNNNIYILNSDADQVLVYDQGGNLLRTIGDSSRIDFAKSIAISYVGTGGTGVIYIADQAKCTIHAYNLDGTYRYSMGSAGSLYTTVWDGKFSGLMAVAADKSGNIHGLDNNLNVVQVFEPQSGTFLSSYNAYPPENEYNLNLQTDLGINPVDNRVTVSNVATISIETVATLPNP